MARYALALIFMVLVAAVYTVYANGQTSRPGTPPQEMVTVTTTTPMSASQPIPIVVRQKGKFTVTLEANHTTGYSWRLAKPVDTKVLKNTGSVYNEPRTDLIGAPGNEVWSFQPVNKGATSFTLEYVRPWEKGVKPVKTQTFKVTVQ